MYTIHYSLLLQQHFCFFLSFPNCHASTNSETPFSKTFTQSLRNSQRAESMLYLQIRLLWGVIRGFGYFYISLATLQQFPSEVIRWGHKPGITTDIMDKQIAEYSEIPLKSTQYKHDKIKHLLKIKIMAFYIFLLLFQLELLLKGQFSAVLKECLTKQRLLTNNEYDIYISIYHFSRNIIYSSSKLL